MHASGTWCLVLMVTAHAAPIVARAQETSFTGPLATIIALPATRTAYRCEPIPIEQAADSTAGMRRCSVRMPERDTVNVDIHVDSTRRVIALFIGWPRTADADSAAAVLGRALAMLQPRLGAPIICARAEVAWMQSFHWDAAAWRASLNVTYDPTRNRMGNAQFHARMKAPDEVVTCMR